MRIAKLANMAGLAALCLWAGAGTLTAGVSISPAYVEVKLDKGRPSGEFVVGNTGDNEERYRIQSVYFTFTPEGGLVRKDPDQYAMSSWIVFNPRELTLPPKTKRVVRFVVSPKGQLTGGEYWAGMELESLNTTTTSTAKNEKGVGMKIEIVSKILVPIFGQFGQVTYSAEAQDPKLVEGQPAATIDTLLTNTGNGRLFMSGKYDLADTTGKIVESGQLPRMYVMRQSDRNYKIAIKAPMQPGKYTYKVELTSQQLKEPITRSLDFEWKPVVKEASK